jgi:hypothetical protein
MKIVSLLLSYTLFYGTFLFGVTHFEATTADAESFRYVIEDDPGSIIKLMLAKPDFTNLNYYSDIYGSTSFYPSFSVGYKMIHIPWVTLSLGGKFSYYKTQGHALDKTSTGEYVSDPEAPIAMTLIPYQFFAELLIYPFDRKYVGLSAWAGYEELYFEENRNLVSTADATSTSNSTATTDKSRVNEINSGWNKSVTFGFSFNLLVNYLEEQSAKALLNTTGLRFIYVAPFMEVSKSLGQGRLFLNQQKASPADYSRTSYGIIFMFET